MVRRFAAEDANVEAAAGIRRSSFYNSGQDCTAAARILVHERVYDEFLSELLPKVEAFPSSRVRSLGGGQAGP
jgi:acyl-CoA reductase-like NAD-dependent aldehyde dehydrogenase